MDSDCMWFLLGPSTRCHWVSSEKASRTHLTSHIHSWHLLRIPIPNKTSCAPGTQGGKRQTQDVSSSRHRRALWNSGRSEGVEATLLLGESTVLKSGPAPGRPQGSASVTCRGVGRCLGNAGRALPELEGAGAREDAAGGRDAVRPQAVWPGSRSGSAGTRRPERPAQLGSRPGSQHQLVAGGRRLQRQAPGPPVGPVGRAPGERACRGSGQRGFCLLLQGHCARISAHQGPTGFLLSPSPTEVHFFFSSGFSRVHTWLCNDTLPSRTPSHTLIVHSELL